MSIISKAIIAIVLTAGVFMLFGTTTPKDHSAELEDFVSNTQLEQDAVYFILRGSETKLGGFAKQYNKTNVHATHVALGIVQDSLQIYHVNTGSHDGHHLISESINDFTSSKKDPYNYLAYWKLEGVGKKDIKGMLEQIDSIKNEEIRFDYKFNFESDNQLYCSEFIYKVLNRATNNRYLLPMTNIAVPEEHKFYIRKDTLACYPSDFFLDYKNITYVSEWIGVP